MRRTLFSVLFLLLAALVTDAPALAGDKYEGITTTVAAPADKVQKAAADALVVLGCDIKKNEPGYLEGPRSRKFGAFVGSGGEVLSIKITSKDDATSEVQVRTTKTMLGRMGQKVWDQQMIDEINKSLNGTGGTPVQSAAAGT